MDIWGAFVDLLERILLIFFDWTGNAGLAIILFTILARILILPLTLTSLRSTRRMQELQPQIKELQRKYGKDQQKLSQETMKLYRENKVNPAGGCLPMLLQMPIFFGVYQAVINLANIPVARSTANTMLGIASQAGYQVADLQQNLYANQLTGGFLWLRDLGRPDPYYILPILSVIFQLLVQLMATPRVQDPQQKAMSQSMLILPLVFGYIGFIFPSGAVLYWVVGSIISVVQQYVVSGWGSLANYLKFLPADYGGLFPHSAPATATASSSAGSVGATTGAASSSAGDQSEEAPSSAPHASFWDVLKPLTEQGSAADEEQSEDDPTERAIEEARRQQQNPRRRRTRR